MREGKKTLSIFMDVSDTLVSAAVLWFCPRIFGVGFGVPVCFLLTLALSFLQRMFDFNSPTVSEERHFRRVLTCNAVFFAFLVLVSALLPGDERHSNMLLGLLASYASLTMLLWLKRRAVAAIFRQQGRARMIIFGDNRDGVREFLRNFNGEDTGFELLGAVGEELVDAGCPVLGDSRELYRIVAREGVSTVILAMREYDRERLANISSRLDELYCTVYFLPVMYGVIKSSSQLEYVGTTPLVRARASALDVMGWAFLKRALDIILALVLLVLFMPVMIFCAIGVKISLGSPIIFKQLRVGRYGREFEIYKFRSMKDGEPSGFDGGRDGRKTRFGNFLRKTSLDELPQLINVLTGEMSLVGPRPEIPFYVEKFRQEIPLYMLKHYVKPGITGLAQVKGLRGATSLTERIKYDLFYIENWSLWLDIKILLMTPAKLINPNEKYNKNITEKH